MPARKITAARVIATGMPISAGAVALTVMYGHTIARETLRGPPLLCGSVLR